MLGVSSNNGALQFRTLCDPVQHAWVLCDCEQAPALRARFAYACRCCCGGCFAWHFALLSNMISCLAQQPSFAHLMLDLQSSNLSTRRCSECSGREASFSNTEHCIHKFRLLQAFKRCIHCITYSYTLCDSLQTTQPQDGLCSLQLL